MHPKIAWALMLGLAMTACSSRRESDAPAPATLSAAPIAAAATAVPAATQAPVASIPLAAAPTVLRDPDGPSGGPAVIGSMRMPEGWQLREIHRDTWQDDSGCPALVSRVAVTLAAPDGWSVLTYGPGDAWVVAGTERDVEACPPRPERDVRAYLWARTQAAHADARLLDYEALPGPAHAMQAQTEAQLGPSDGPELVHRSYSAGRLLTAYRQDGVEMRELSIALMMLSQAPDGNLLAYTPGAIAYHAPDGQLDFSLPGRVESTKQFDPAWQQGVDERTERARRRYEDSAEGKHAAALNAAIVANAQVQLEQQARNQADQGASRLRPD